MNDTTPATEALGHVMYFLDRILPLIRTNFLLVASALLPIYAGAHASLHRPVSAAKPPKQKSKNESATAKLDEEETNILQGFEMSDVVLYPVLAGATLGGLYLLITYLQESAVAILTAALNAYMSIFGLVGVFAFSSDTVNVVSSYVFPSKYFEDGRVWLVDGNRRLTLPTKMSETDRHPGVRTSPWPRSLARLSVLPEGLLWHIRDLSTRPALIIKSKILGLEIGLQPTAARIICAQLTILAIGYYNLIDRAWWLTNLLGFSFTYSAFQILSPTTFLIGTLLLSVLLLYDIYMVFFTPLMITVATKLDIPAKIMIPNPESADMRAFAMLGLGDIVIPGIMMALALRFDLYMFYLKKQRLVSAKKVEEKSQSIATDGSSSTCEKEYEVISKETATKSEDEIQPLQSKSPVASNTKLNPDSTTKPQQTYAKAVYQKVTGTWGDRYWLGNHSAAANGASVSYYGSFPKPYFHASVAGYLLGMGVTMAVLHIFKHGQPALLYLVPGVLGSIWLTAAIKGEVQIMWKYTEDADQGRAAEIDSAAILGKKHRPVAVEYVSSRGMIEGKSENGAGEAEEKGDSSKQLAITENGDKTSAPNRHSKQEEQGLSRNNITDPVSPISAPANSQNPGQDLSSTSKTEPSTPPSTITNTDPKLQPNSTEPKTDTETNTPNKERRIFQLTISLPPLPAHQIAKEKQRQQQTLRQKQAKAAAAEEEEEEEGEKKEENSTVDWAEGEPWEKRRRVTVS